jgi:hypothetical protein
MEGLLLRKFIYKSGTYIRDIKHIFGIYSLYPVYSHNLSYVKYPMQFIWPISSTKTPLKTDLQNRMNPSICPASNV